MAFIKRKKEQMHQNNIVYKKNRLQSILLSQDGMGVVEVILIIVEIYTQNIYVQYVFTYRYKAEFVTVNTDKNKYIQKAGIKDYDFRSHDFRHTVGTYLYLHGASIEVIRDYLGQKESDMTKQQIDYMPELIDKKNEEYFKSKDSLLVPFTKKGEKYGQKDFS